MKKSTTFTNLVQTLLKEEDVKKILETLGYSDPARRFTAHQLLLFFTHAALGEWESYRSGVGKAITCGLLKVDYSTFSSKASSIPYDLFKQLFHLLISRCNRATRRQMSIPKELLLVDSTTITVGKSRLPWALFHGDVQDLNFMFHLMIPRRNLLRLLKRSVQSTMVQSVIYLQTKTTSWWATVPTAKSSDLISMFVRNSIL
jgi:hypothetical protein